MIVAGQMHLTIKNLDHASDIWDMVYFFVEVDG